MKSIKDKNGDNVYVGSTVIAELKGRMTPVSAKVTDVKTKFLTVNHEGRDYKLRGESVVLYREPKEVKVEAPAGLERGDWVIINKPQSPVHKHKGRIIHFPSSTLAYVLVPREGKSMLAPVCDINWLVKV